jgi:TonB family protein
VYIRAVIEPDGTVREANVVRGIGGGCDGEALRVVEDAQFIPAKVNGQPVPSYTTVWIQFSLQD